MAVAHGPRTDRAQSTVGGERPHPGGTTHRTRPTGSGRRPVAVARAMARRFAARGRGPFVGLRRRGASVRRPGPRRLPVADGRRPGGRRRHGRRRVRPHTVAGPATPVRRAGPGRHRVGGAGRGARVLRRLRTRLGHRSAARLAARPGVVRAAVDGAAFAGTRPARRSGPRADAGRSAARRLRRAVDAGLRRARHPAQARGPAGAAALRARSADQPKPVRGRPDRRRRRRGTDLRHPRPRPTHPARRPRPGPAHPPDWHPRPGPARRDRQRSGPARGPAGDRTRTA